MADDGGAGVGDGVVRLAIHYHPKTAAPLGVWAPPLVADGEPRDHYLVPTARDVGHDQLALHARDTWDANVAYLAQRAPYTAWWEYLDVAADVDPAGLLRDLAGKWAQDCWNTKVTLAPGSLAEK